MNWTRNDCGYGSKCRRVIIERYRGQWRIQFDPSIAPNGIAEELTDTLKRAKAIAEAAIEHADNRTGLREELHKRLSDGERYRAALEAIRMRCEASESVDSAGLRWLVDEALRSGAGKTDSLK